MTNPVIYKVRVCVRAGASKREISEERKRGEAKLLADAGPGSVEWAILPSSGEGAPRFHEAIAERRPHR